MKYLIVIVFTLYGLTSFAQESEIKKPEYVIVADNEIITEERLVQLMQEGIVKSMNKGVSQSVRNELAKTFGEKIGDKEFVIVVELYSANDKPKETPLMNHDETKPDEFKLHNGDLAKDFTVKMIDGSMIKLSELKGKVVLLNFWATWCAPCLMEFHEIPDKILKPYNNTDFVFIPISRGENKETVETKMLHLNKKGIDFNVGIDPEEEIWNQYATQSIPKNFVIDKYGYIRYTSTGNSEGSIDKLAKEIEILLDE